MSETEWMGVDLTKIPRGELEFYPFPGQYFGDAMKEMGCEVLFGVVAADIWPYTDYCSELGMKTIVFHDERAVQVAVHRDVEQAFFIDDDRYHGCGCSVCVYASFCYVVQFPDHFHRLGRIEPAACHIEPPAGRCVHHLVRELAYLLHLGVLKGAGACPSLHPHRSRCQVGIVIVFVPPELSVELDGFCQRTVRAVS